MTKRISKLTCAMVRCSPSFAILFFVSLSACVGLTAIRSETDQPSPHVFSCVESLPGSQVNLIDSAEYSPFPKSLPVSSIVFVKATSALRVRTTRPADFAGFPQICEFEVSSDKYIYDSIRPQEGWDLRRSPLELARLNSVEEHCRSLSAREQDRRFGYVSSILDSETGNAVTAGSFIGCELYAQSSVIYFSIKTVGGSKEIYSVVGDTVFKNGQDIGVIE